jgi:hypothetical protein
MESTTRALAEHLDITIDELEVEVVGDVDARGCLAIERSVRSGFQHIDVDVRLRAAPGTEAARMEHFFGLDGQRPRAMGMRGRQHRKPSEAEGLDSESDVGL